MTNSSDPKQDSGKIPVDTLISARWIIPVRPMNQVFEDCCIAINQGKIEAIIPVAEAKKRYQPKEFRHLENHVLIPGLINAHGHSGMSLMRGFADDLALEKWLQDFIWPAEAQWVGSEFVKDGCLLAMAEMIRGGTTCFSDMYFFPDAVGHAAQAAGMRTQLYAPVLDFPSAWAQSADEYISKAITVHDDFRSSDLVDVGFGPHAPYTVSDAPFKRLAVLAEELQAGIHAHLHETAHEVSESIKQYGKRPIERLAGLGVLSPLAQCVHMTQIEESDIEILKRNGCHIIHCPESNLKLASGFCPVSQLLEADVNVALGTDSTASNNDLDLFGEMRTAALLAKGVSGNPATVDAHQALRLATINGAKAIGKEDQLGSLETGKAADITAIKLDDVESHPMYNVASHLVYTNISHNVTDVWVNGKPLMRERQLQTLDTETIIANAKKWQSKLASQAYRK